MKTTDSRMCTSKSVSYSHRFGAWANWLCQGKYLDGLPRCSRKNKAIVRWVFQPLPWPVGFTWELIYESGSRTPLKGCVVRGAVHPGCSQPSPVRFTAPVRLLAAPPRGRGINGLDLMSGYDTIRYDTRCYFNVRSKADISQLP